MNFSLPYILWDIFLNNKKKKKDLKFASPANQSGSKDLKIFSMTLQILSS